MRGINELANQITRLQVTGNSPLARFGHTMTAVSRSKVILFGGATGDTGKFAITGDTFCFDMANLSWSKVNQPAGVSPSPRAAHAACAVQAYQMVIYGGATGGGSLASDDLYLLDMRSGQESASWMIVPVIGSTPGRRYGHTLVFIKPHLIVFGGNTGNEPINDVWCLNVEKSPFSWVKIQVTTQVPRPRVYHSACLCQTGSAMGMMVVFGGRTTDQSALNDTWGLRRHRDGHWSWVRAPYKPNGELPLARYQHSVLFLGTSMVVIGGRTNQVGQTVPLELYDTENSEWTKLPSIQRFRHTSWSLDSQIFIHGGFEHQAPNIPTDSIIKVAASRFFVPAETAPQIRTLIQSTRVERPLPQVPRNTNKTPEIRLANQVFVSVGQDSHQNNSESVQRVSIDRLPQEGRRLGIKALPPGVSKNVNSVQSISTLFLNQLLKSSDSPTDTRFGIRKQAVLALIEECQNIVKTQSNVIRIRAPVKVFGNINGQYHDLLRFFQTWGQPTDHPNSGDIQCFDYLFLGGYVDRGIFSLQTICLLMALKVKHPQQIFLLRGHHQTIETNSKYGLAQECRIRLDDDLKSANSVFARLNQFFEYLSLSAVIDGKILAIHSGIGHSLASVAQIEAITKPVGNPTENPCVVDLLWSDPCENQRENGIKINSFRESLGMNNVVKFGMDRLQKFLEENKLSMVIRSHQCAMDGFDRSQQGELITVFSATDYCGKYKNMAACLTIKRNLEIVPKLIYPLTDGGGVWNDSEEVMTRCPATPPRWKTRNG